MKEIEKYETLSKFKDSGYVNIVNAFTHLSKNIDEWVRKNKIEASFFDGQTIEKRGIYSLMENSLLEYSSKYNIDTNTYGWCDSLKIHRFRYSRYWLDTKKVNFLSKSTLNRMAKLIWIINKNGINIKTVKHFTKFLYLKFGIHRVKYTSNVDKSGKIINKMLPRTLYKKEYILDIDYQSVAMKRLNKLNVLENKFVFRWWNKLRNFTIHF